MVSAVSWGDNLYPHMRAVIEQGFRTRVFDNYGCAEGFIVATQCEQGAMHQQMHGMILEVLDESGQPVRAGEVGDVVVTRLHAGAMPLVRHRVGDRVRLAAQDAVCSCGRELRTLAAVEGRSGEVIVTASGERLMGHFFSGLVKTVSAVEAFDVAQLTPARIVVRVVLDKATTNVSETLGELNQRLQSRVGDDIEVVVERVASLTLRATGKRSVISRSETPEVAPAVPDNA